MLAFVPLVLRSDCPDHTRTICRCAKLFCCGLLMSGENTAAASVGGAKLLPRHKLSGAGYGARFVCPLHVLLHSYTRLEVPPKRPSPIACKVAWFGDFLELGNWVSQHSYCKVPQHLGVGPNFCRWNPAISGIFEHAAAAHFSYQRALLGTGVVPDGGSVGFS